MDALAAWFQETLLPYGAWGVLFLAAMDSTFVSMPGVIDIAVMAAAALSPHNAVYYWLGASAGSTLGVLVICCLARSGRYAAGTGSGNRTRWAEDFLARRGTLALLVAALMPTPFPFKLVVIAAGFFKQPLPSVVIGVGTGRLIRFGVEAFLAARYGDDIIAQVQQNGPAVALALALLFALGGYAVYRFTASLRHNDAA